MPHVLAHRHRPDLWRIDAPSEGREEDLPSDRLRLPARGNQECFVHAAEFLIWTLCKVVIQWPRIG